MCVLVHQDCVSALFTLANRKGNRLGNSSWFIEQRRASHRKTGEVLNHGLKINQRFKATLGDFGLIRRVGRVPRGVFQDVAFYDGGSVSVVITATNQAGVHRILIGV